MNHYYETGKHSLHEKHEDLLIHALHVQKKLYLCIYYYYFWLSYSKVSIAATISPYKF